MNKSAFAILAAALAGCSGFSNADTSDTPPTTTPPVITTLTTEEAVTTTPMEQFEEYVGEMPDWFQSDDSAPGDLVDVIAKELGARYVGSMGVAWNNSGLGCSNTGYFLQVITPGYVIFFASDSDLIRVHTNESGHWVECDIDRPLEAPPHSDR